MMKNTVRFWTFEIQFIWRTWEFSFFWIKSLLSSLFISVSLRFLSLDLLIISSIFSFIFSFILSLLFHLLLPSCLVSSSPVLSCSLSSCLVFCCLFLSCLSSSVFSSLSFCLLSLLLSVSLCRVVLCVSLWSWCGVCGVARWKPPCVHPKRPRACRQHAHMCFNMYASCRYTWGRFERTHGHVLNGHGGEGGGRRPFCLPKFAHIGLSRDPEVHQK